MPLAPQRSTRAAATRAREADAEEYGCWLVALTAVDGKSYVYRVYAPPDALPGDLFWEAWHSHDEGPFPRAYDLFDTAAIQHIGNLHQY